MAAKRQPDRDISMFAAMEFADTIPELAKVTEKLLTFTKLIREIQTVPDQTQPSKIIEAVYKRSGYMDMLLSEDSVENQTRIENIQEFILSAEGI